ncbi:hypothetical protein LTR08_000645 [Meristemomyces frigidus]|nr:hypothetical protein LTR08_000645 [Meristemomyces frigidus]
MAPSFPTTILIAHDAFHKASAYDTLATHLATFDLRTIVPQLPSASRCSPPDPFAADTAMFHNAVVAELMTGHNVVVLAHGYGGLPGCEALQHLPLRSSKAGIGRILGIIFVAAFVAEEGESFATAMEGGQPEWCDDMEGAVANISDHATATTLFNTVSNPRDRAEYATHLTAQALDVFNTDVTYAGWEDYRTVSIHCTRDNSQPADAQDHFDRKLWRGADDHLGHQELESDHCPHVSMPETLAHKVAMIKEVFKMLVREERMKRMEVKEMKEMEEMKEMKKVR